LTKSIGHMDALAPTQLTLEAKGSAIYRSLYKQIVHQILAGHLEPNARLPSSRNMAAELGCSRGTVERAYEMLLAEGYVCAAGAAGTRVNPNLESQLIKSEGWLAELPEPDIEETHAPEPTLAVEPQYLPLQMGLPALDAFPRKYWNRLINKHARSGGVEQLIRGCSFGHFPLRRALANYLAISRGVNAEPEQIFITAGFQGALNLILQCLGHAGDEVWCEDPGYFRVRDCVKQLAMSVIPVSVDEEGLRVEEGIKNAPNARFALVTPTHQAPLGVTLSLQRRMALLNWADCQASWVIEDDYDSEFRYGEQALPALKSLDACQRVIYTGSFSKVLSPSLKLGYVVVPKPLQSRFEVCCSSLASVGSSLEQKAVAEMIIKGQFSLHIKKMRSLYGQRRDALAAALNDRLSHELKVKCQPGGMHIIVELLNVTDAKRLQKVARKLGLGLCLLSAFEIRSVAPPSLLLSFTNVPVSSADGVAETLAEAIAQVRK